MKNENYLSETYLNTLILVCEDLFSSANVAQLHAIETKFKIKFTLDRQTNINLIWFAIRELLVADLEKGDIRNPNNSHVYTYADFTRTENNSPELMDYYIDENYRTEWRFIANWNVSDLPNTFLYAGLYHGITVKEFVDLKEALGIANYRTYFTNLYGITNANPTKLAVTERIITFYEDLTAGTQCQNVFNLLAQYGLDKDKSTLHRDLHKEN